MFREGLESSGMRASLAMIIPRTAHEHGVTSGDAERDGERYYTETDLVGHVSGCDCIIVDDMIDSASTLCTAANELTSLGAVRAPWDRNNRGAESSDRTCGPGSPG